MEYLSFFMIFDPFEDYELVVLQKFSGFFPLEYRAYFWWWNGWLMSDSGPHTVLTRFHMALHCSVTGGFISFQPSNKEDDQETSPLEHSLSILIKGCVLKHVLGNHIPYSSTYCKFTYYQCGLIISCSRQWDNVSFSLNSDIGLKRTISYFLLCPNHKASLFSDKRKYSGLLTIHFSKDPLSRTVSSPCHWECFWGRLLLKCHGTC